MSEKNKVKHKLNTIDTKHLTVKISVPSTLSRYIQLHLLSYLSIQLLPFNSFLTYQFSSLRFPSEMVIVVPTPLVWGGTIYSNGLFLFRQFWPIDIFILEKCEWYH